MLGVSEAGIDIVESPAFTGGGICRKGVWGGKNGTLWEQTGTAIWAAGTSGLPADASVTARRSVGCDIDCGVA